jgi:hypothetical protein
MPERYFRGKNLDEVAAVSTRRGRRDLKKIDRKSAGDTPRISPTYRPGLLAGASTETCRSLYQRRGSS